MTTTLQSTHDLLDEALAICAGQTDAPPTREHLEAMFAEITKLNGEIGELLTRARPDELIDIIDRTGEYLADCIREEAEARAKRVEAEAHYDAARGRARLAVIDGGAR